MSKFAILGYGRMGKMVEKICRDRAHEVAATLDVDAPLRSLDQLQGAEAVIDFTLPNTVMQNLQTVAELNIPIVEGTTGWHKDLETAMAIPNLTMIWSPNFSIGVYFFQQLVKQASKLFGSIKEVDAFLHEWHHTGKADSPSGTALQLAHLMVDNLPQKSRIFTETSHEPIASDALHVTSSRVGRVPGTHRIGFDSPFDSVTLEHQAHGREGFAYGAVRAAEWILGKRGVFTMQDFMDDFLSKAEIAKPQ
ncbi:4-hydroxy-tetrahydrodipicolinate reductase [candidate division KSB1 bacterium]|nr:4-hydroxy-tetrahydrodipicolinate reductase [candidate division KSB1 bacterium]